MSLYDELGVARDATKDQIDAAYRKAAMKKHPDRGGTEEEFKALKMAHTVLSNTESRETYDKTGRVDGASANQGNPAVSALAIMMDGAVDADVVDIVAYCRAHISQQQDSMASVERKIAKAQKSLARHRSRIKRQGKDEILSGVLDSKQDKINLTLEKIKNDREIVEAMLDLLVEYEVSGTEEEPQWTTSYYTTA